MARIRDDIERPTILFAQVSVGTATADGLSMSLVAGDPWDATDPFVRHRPDLFGPEPPAHVIRRTVTKGKV